MFEWMASVAGSLLGGALMDRKHDREATAVLEAFADGQPVRVPCALRYAGTTAWLHGDLLLSDGSAPMWAPPTLPGRVRIAPQIESTRRVTFAESFDISPDCLILAVHAAGRAAEIAVPARNMPVVECVL